MRRETKRTALQEVIPLETPFVLHIELTNVCNLKCKFCTEQNEDLMRKLGIQRGFMKRDVFESIIDNLKKFPKKLKRLYLYHGGESLLHKDAISFIQYAKQAQIAEQLVLFTNGTLLTEQLGTELAHSGLDLIQISVEGVSAEQYEEIAGRRIDYDKFLAGIANLYRQKPLGCELHAKILDCGLSEEDKAKFHRDFAGISDQHYIEQLLDSCPADVMDTTLGRGATTTQEGKELKEKLVCTQPFYVSVIYYDGTVGGCSCGDWRRATHIGNVTEEMFYQIWNGEKHRAFCRLQLAGERKKCLSCSDCKDIQNQLDDIDTYRMELLKRLDEKQVIV